MSWGNAPKTAQEAQQQALLQQNFLDKLQGFINQSSGEISNKLDRLIKLMTPVQDKGELVTLYPWTEFDSKGYRYNVLVVPDGGAGKKLTVKVQGISYQLTLVAGVNQTNFVHGSELSMPDNTISMVIVRSNNPSLG